MPRRFCPLVVALYEKEKSEDHDHMCTKVFLRESWSWSSFFSSSGADFQRTMTIRVARLLRGNLGHGHRLFLPDFSFSLIERWHCQGFSANRCYIVWPGERRLRQPHSSHWTGQAANLIRKQTTIHDSFGRGEKTPTPKTRFSIWTLLRTLGHFTTRPLPVYFTTKMSVVRPFSVLSKAEIGP